MLEQAEEFLPVRMEDNEPPFVVPIEEGREFRGEIFMRNPEFWATYLVGETGTIVFVEEGEGGHSFSHPLNLRYEPFRFFWNIAADHAYFSGNVRISVIEWETRAGHYPIYVG